MIDVLILVVLAGGVLYLLNQQNSNVGTGPGGSAQLQVSFTDVLGNTITSTIPYTFAGVDPNQIVKMAQAISQAEGYGVPGAIPTVANNPGDLTYSFGYSTSGTRGSAGIVVFNSAQDGWSALFTQVGKMLSGSSGVYNQNMSLQDVAAVYAQDRFGWSNNVAQSMGISPTATLGQIATNTA